ncbi:hypothetical protein PVAND_010755 [Polypedilum vanderplanki]|uniref:Uncharacterized protein n=1 Tax=Polypedilum vanderplanki TaxID=319348 RepID=A0A9J6CGI8_POLVA|nr:hypothetical protein PVAND_010755 [Polypedilum vanderplanki]
MGKIFNHNKIKHKPVFEALHGLPKIVKFLIPKSNTTKIISESWPLDYIWFTDSSISRITKYLLTAVIFKKILIFLMLGALMFFIPVLTTSIGDNSNFHYFRHTDDDDDEEDEKKDEKEENNSRIMYLKKYPCTMGQNKDFFPKII